jgi:hypothetical protein
MKYKMSCFLLLICLGGRSQVNIQHGAGVHLQQNAGLYVQGDVSSADNITGAGSVWMIGDAIQSVNGNGFSVPALAIKNREGVSLTGDLRINRLLTLTDGDLLLNQYKLIISQVASIENESQHGVVTNASGVIRKLANSDLRQYFIPLSNTTGYTPLVLSTRGKYHNGFVEVSSSAERSTNKPAEAQEFLDKHWKVVSGGIDGEVNAIAMAGTGSSSANLSGYVWQDGKWKISPYERGSIRATIKNGEAEIYAMSIRRHSLQPNPAVNSTTLVYTSDNEGSSQLVVTDAHGRIVQVRTVSVVKGINRYNIDLGSLAKGYYDVSVIQQEKKTTLKLVRQ